MMMMMMIIIIIIVKWEFLKMGLPLGTLGPCQLRLVALALQDVAPAEDSDLS